MKNKITLLLPLVLFSCASVVQFTEDEHLSEIYDDVRGSQDQLFLRANSWMIATFKNAESVIQHSDKEAGVIIGKYLMAGTLATSMYGTVDSRVYAIIDIRVKDDRARIEVKPQDSWRYDDSGMTIYTFSKEDAKQEMITLSKGFHNALLKEDVEF